MASNKNGNKDNYDDSADDMPPQIPYRRDRTPSIVVQSLGISFKKDSNITESIELPNDDEELSPNVSETSDPKSTTSGTEDAHNAPACYSSGNSARGSSSSLHNSSPPGAASPVSAKNQPTTAAARAMMGASNNRRLSLNIGSMTARRQSLTVEGLSSSGLLSSASRDLQYSGNATGSLRNKVALKPGHSLMGWIKLASTAKDLSGTGGKIIEVTPEELAKHDTENNCWVALKGNVYNVTTYLQYHPGGVDELMRGAGRDVTDLFNEVHRWVNYESILAKCLVGPYKIESPLTPVGRTNFRTLTDDSPPPTTQFSQTTSTTPTKKTRKDPTVAQRPNRRQSIALTVPSPNKYQSLLLNNNSNSNLNQVQQPPTYVIMQDKSCIKLKVQDLTRLTQIRTRHLICDLLGLLELRVSVILSFDWLYRIHLRLDKQVEENFAAELNSDNGTITITINKPDHTIWGKIGTTLGLNDSLCEMTLADKFFRPCRLASKTQLTHDTYLFEFKLAHTLMYVPIGWHVLIREHLPNSNDVDKRQEQLDASREFDDRRIYKNYTPVLPILANDQMMGHTDECGFMKSLHFIIKIYPDGMLTSKLNQLNIGDNVDISDYQCVDFDVEAAVNSSTKHWFLLAGGTGVTPFCRIISFLLSPSNNEQVESVTLLFFNKTLNDIIWRDQFDRLQSRHGAKFKVVHVLSDESEDGLSGWSGRRGRVSKTLIASFVDSCCPDELRMLACGPRPFTQAIKSIVNDLNLNEKLYVFHG